MGGMTNGVVLEQVYIMIRNLALPQFREFTAYTGDETATHATAWYVPHRIAHVYKDRAAPPSDIIQPRDLPLHWLPIVVDGEWRSEAWYVH